MSDEPDRERQLRWLPDVVPELERQLHDWRQTVLDRLKGRTVDN